MSCFFCCCFCSSQVILFCSKKKNQKKKKKSVLFSQNKKRLGVFNESFVFFLTVPVRDYLWNWKLLFSLSLFFGGIFLWIMTLTFNLFIFSALICSLKVERTKVHRKYEAIFGRLLYSWRKRVFEFWKSKQMEALKFLV